MGSGRVSANVGKIQVESQQDATLIGRCPKNWRIIFASKSFTDNGLDVISFIAQSTRGVAWHVFIELEPQRLTSVCNGYSSSSWASHAAYPSAASISKGSSVGYWRRISSRLS